jgi:copper chaperone CopZ
MNKTQEDTLSLIVRILLVLFALLLVAFATVLLITPLAVADFIEQLDNVTPIARIAAVIILYLIGLGLITLRFRSRPRTDGDMLYVRAAGAQAALTVGSVRDRILKAVSQVPGVASVEAALKSINGRADVELTVVTTDDKVNIPEKQREIYRTLEQVIKKQLGVDLATRPRVNIELGRSAPLNSNQYGSAPSVNTSTPAAPLVTPPAVPVDAAPVATAPPALPTTPRETFSEATPKSNYGVSTDASSSGSSSGTFLSTGASTSTPTSISGSESFDEDETNVDEPDADTLYEADDDSAADGSVNDEDWPPKYSEPL